MNNEERMQVTVEYLLSWAFGRRVEHDGHENLTQAAQRVLKDPSTGGWRAHTARTFLDSGNTYPTRLRRASAQAAAQFVIECAEGEE